MFSFITWLAIIVPIASIALLGVFASNSWAWHQAAGIWVGLFSTSVSIRAYRIFHIGEVESKFRYARYEAFEVRVFDAALLAAIGSLIVALVLLTLQYRKTPQRHATFVAAVAIGACAMLAIETVSPRFFLLWTWSFCVAYAVMAWLWSLPETRSNASPG